MSCAARAAKEDYNRVAHMSCAKTVGLAAAQQQQQRRSENFLISSKEKIYIILAVTTIYIQHHRC